MIKIVFIISIIVPSIAFAKNVAVLDFSNNTGQKNLQFLSFSLAETISNTIAKDKDLQTIERAQINKVIKELNFQLISRLKILQNANSSKELLRSAQQTSAPLKKIELLNADYLILGSYQGTKNLAVFIRAIDVSTGKIMTSIMVKGTLESIFPKIEEAASRILAYLKGKKFYCLSVNSFPASAEVYLNDYKIGTTPLACHKVVNGTHDLTLIKSGYKKHAQVVQVNNKKLDIDIAMLSMDRGHKTGLSVGYFYFNSFDFSKNQDHMLSFRLGQNFNFLRISIEYAQTMGNLEYGYTYAVPYDTRKENRTIRTYQANMLLSAFPFSTLAYASPYFGVQTGYCHILETGVASEYFGNRKKGHDLYTFGGFAGIVFLPYSRISFFTEIRYLKSFINDNREIVDHISFGNINKTEKKVTLSAYQIGGGINLFF